MVVMRVVTVANLVVTMVVYWVDTRVEMMGESYFAW